MSLKTFMTSSIDTPCRIDRRADYQGSRPSAVHQAEVEKYATGCDGLSPSTSITGTRTDLRTAVIPVSKKLQYNNIKIATINVRTLQDEIKIATTIQAAAKLKIDVLAMQETRILGCEKKFFQDDSLYGWQLVWSGLKRKRFHGVAFLLAPHVQLEQFTEYVPARLLAVTVRCKGLKLALLNGYAPIDDAKDSTKTLFYRALGKAKRDLNGTPSYKVVTLGDFNATISSTSKASGAWDSILGSNNSDRVETTDNGDRFLKWCLEHEMKMVNSFFRSKRIHRGTWRNPRTGKWKRIDYICTTGWMMKFVRKCRAYIGPSPLFDTDHRLLVMDVQFPSTKKHLQYELSRRPSREDTERVDFSTLCYDQDLQKELSAKIDSHLGVLYPNDVDELNDLIATAVKESAEEVCPKIRTAKKKEPWEDETLQEMMRDLGSTTDGKQIRAKQKIKKRRCFLKRQYYKELADNINTVAQAREVEKEFALAKKYCAFKQGQPKAISNEKLKSHFQEHFKARDLPIPPELEFPDRYQHLYQDEKFPIDESVPGAEETDDALKTFKNGKSGGTDKVKTEGLKYNHSELLIKAILMLMSIIWTTIKVPSSWLHASITCLYKKGVMSLAKNYRGISISANMSRILAKIILGRLKTAYENHLGESQFGFRKNKSTSDAIFILKTLVEKYSGQLVVVYIDLSAAYDHIPRDFLFRVISLRTGATHLVEILKKMYEGTTACIRGMEARFDVLIGCRQGGQESPCLFNYYFDYVLKVAASEIDKRFPNGWGVEGKFSIPHWCTNRQQRMAGKMRGVQVIRWILYADDAVLFCKTPEDAEKILNILNDTCKRFGLTISFKKTKTQVFNNPDLAQKESLFAVEGEKIENVKQFTYLGQVISATEECCFTEYRIARANAKFNELRKVLCDYKINKRTRKKIMEACVRSRLTYGLQAAYPNEAQLKKLEACWSQLLRSMVRGGWRRQGTDDDGDFRFVYTNRRIEELLGTLPLRDYIDKQYLKYIGHVCRLENFCLAKVMLFTEPARRYFRDPWIKISNLLGLSIEQCKKLTQSRSEFAGLVNSTFNPPQRRNHR